LTNHLQRVKSRGIFLDWGLVRGGILQGSAFGPLLFLVYMNEMAHHVKYNRLLQYADDIVLICSGIHCQDVHQQLSEDLKLLWSWVESSKKRINVNKSSVIWFLPRSFRHFALPPVLINNIILQRVTVQKYLDVLIDDQLDWSAQISNIIIRHFLTAVRKCLIIYFGLILSESS